MGKNTLSLKERGSKQRIDLLGGLLYRRIQPQVLLRSNKKAGGKTV